MKLATEKTLLDEVALIILQSILTGSVSHWMDVPIYRDAELLCTRCYELAETMLRIGAMEQ